MAEAKREFRFPSQSAVPASEYRVASALEHIAHYLSRIDDHLEQLVKVVDGNGAGFPMIREEIQKLREVVDARVRL